MDRYSLEELFDLYYRDVYHFSLYFTNNKEEAEDITQETFMKVMKHLDSIKDPSKAKTWILSIAKNCAIDMHRKKKVYQLIPETIGQFFKGTVEVDYDRQLIQQDEWEILQNALLKLKPQYRNVIILRGLKELDNKETAEVLGCSEGKVRVDYHRALKQLKEQTSAMKGGHERYEQTKER